MSLEAFCARFPAEPIIKRMVKDVKAQRNSNGRSLVGILAEELVKMGAEGFKSLTRTLQSAEDTTVVPDMRLMNKLPPDVRAGAFNNLAAAVFGISVVCIEDAMMAMITQNVLEIGLFQYIKKELNF